jgi:diguanylate cyclase
MFFTPSNARASILIVDDMPSNIRLLREAVKDLGEVYYATNGETALDLARQRKPDIILLDIEMPDMDGYSVCRAIKADTLTRDAAVIFVTSHEQESYELKALESGGIDFIHKPLNVPVANARVKTHLALQQQIRQLLIAKRDLEEMHSKALRMTHLAEHDALTNLPNPVLLRDRAEQAIKTAERTHNKVAMMLLDIDYFKAVNDEFGHRVGDRLLQQISQALTSILRIEDTACRQGGDEFIILLTDIISTKQVAEFACRILDLFKQSWTIDNQAFSLSVSLGISIYPNDSLTMDDLHRHADVAMYSAKQEGRDCFQFFSKDIEVRIQNRRLQEKELRTAIEQNQLEVFYQPKIAASTQTIIGVEALVRWRKESGDLVFPDHFIPLAEETGLIIPLGEWVLAQACKQAMIWKNSGFNLQIAVNISAVQFEDDEFIDKVENIIVNTGINANSLELEITESVLANINDANKIISSLKQLGVRIALDDFGTGYSSLSYLKHFPLDLLKIDQSFVRNMLVDTVDSAIVKAIVHMANGLNLMLVAEGVETQEHAQVLADLGCEIMQGYYYSRPIPEKQMTQLLEQGILQQGISQSSASAKTS